MKPWEIENEINKNSFKIKELYKEIDKVQEENIKLYKAKQLAIYDIVLDFVKVGDVFVSTIRTGIIRPKDKIEIVRKNKKSVVIKILERTISRYDSTLRARVSNVTNPNIVERIRYENLGKSIYMVKSYRDQIESVIKRDDLLKSLLN